MHAWFPTSWCSALPSPPPPPVSLAERPGASRLLLATEAHRATSGPIPAPPSCVNGRYARRLWGRRQERGGLGASARKTQGAGELSWSVQPRDGLESEWSLVWDPWHGALSSVLPCFSILSHLLDEDKKYTLLLFPDDTREERELIHQTSTLRSEQLSEGTRRMAPNQENTI